MSNPQDNFDSKAEIERLRNDFEPRNLSKKICEAIKNQKDIDKAIKEIIKECLENDVVTQKIIKAASKEAIAEERWSIWLKILTAIGALVVAFIGGGYLV